MEDDRKLIKVAKSAFDLLDKLIVLLTAEQKKPVSKIDAASIAIIEAVERRQKEAE